MENHEEGRLLQWIDQVIEVRDRIETRERRRMIPRDYLQLEGTEGKKALQDLLDERKKEARIYFRKIWISGIITFFVSLFFFHMMRETIQLTLVSIGVGTAFVLYYRWRLGVIKDIYTKLYQKAMVSMAGVWFHEIYHSYKGPITDFGPRDVPIHLAQRYGPRWEINRVQYTEERRHGSLDLTIIKEVKLKEKRREIRKPAEFYLYRSDDREIFPSFPRMALYFAYRHSLLERGIQTLTDMVLNRKKLEMSSSTLWEAFDIHMIAIDTEEEYDVHHELMQKITPLFELSLRWILAHYGAYSMWIDNSTMAIDMALGVHGGFETKVKKSYRSYISFNRKKEFHPSIFSNDELSPSYVIPALDKLYLPKFLEYIHRGILDIESGAEDRMPYVNTVEKTIQVDFYQQESGE